MALKDDDPMVITGPRINRKETRREYITPTDLMRAIVAHFGPMGHDLAATKTSSQAPKFFGKKQDAFKQDWTKVKIPGGSNMWLNCPFSKIPKWAERSEESWKNSCPPLLFLTPASTGTNWYSHHIFDKADVYHLRGRVKFTGEKDYYPKDLMLSDFSPEAKGRQYIWDWRTDEIFSLRGNVGKGRWFSKKWGDKPK